MKSFISSLSSFALGLGLAASAVEAVSLPGCVNNASTLQEATLNNVRTATLNVSGNPFGAVYAKHQRDIAFYTTGTNNTAGFDSSLNILNTSTFPPTLLRRYSLPETYVKFNRTFEGAQGVTLLHDGRYLFLAAGPGAIVIDTARALAGLPASDIVVGLLNGTTATQDPGVQAIEITLSKDNQYAFVSQEYGPVDLSGIGNIDVFKLHWHHNGSVTSTPVGFVSLGSAVVGSALSPDGRRLYVTSEVSGQPNKTGGILSVLDVKTLQVNPSKAVLANATAGCQPVRVIVSKDGKTVWTTPRASNYLLAFDAATLVSDPNNALRAAVQVGTEPVGLTFAQGESRIITADSDRDYYPGATSGLTVVDVDAAFEGESAVLGRIPTGLFPREFAVSPDGKTLLVADHDSQQIQVVDVTTLP